MKCIIIAAAVLVAGAMAVPRVRRDSSPDNFELISNATSIRANIQFGFDCANYDFGYYADQANDCQIFHLCYPFEDAEGVPQLRMWSFLCGLGTIFDQESLTCNYPENSFPCVDADQRYNINSYFHRESLEFRDGSF